MHRIVHLRNASNLVLNTCNRTAYVPDLDIPRFARERQRCGLSQAISHDHRDAIHDLDKLNVLRRDLSAATGNHA
jgi:hypothetical protein